MALWSVIRQFSKQTKMFALEIILDVLRVILNDIKYLIFVKVLLFTIALLCS